MKAPMELSERFRGKGFKVTLQRQCILGTLHDNGSDPTGHSVHRSAWEELPTISRRTDHHLVCTRCDARRDVLCDLAGLRSRCARIGASPSQPLRSSSAACAPSVHKYHLKETARD